MPGTDVAVASGAAMTSDTDVEGTVRARIGGLPVKAFATIMQKAPGAIMSLAENPINTLADFPGKTTALAEAHRRVAELLPERYRPTEPTPVL